MRIGIYTDVHFSETSSLVSMMGEKYTKRLELLIAGLNWAEQEAITRNCTHMMSLGDFFDKPDLTSMELTALKEIKWNSLPHLFLVGNHEGSENTLSFNSVNALRGFGFKIIEQPMKVSNTLFLPYIGEDERKSLAEYWQEVGGENEKCRIVFSHNAIKGINYGGYISKEGFDSAEIDSFCDLFLNGHLHNGADFSQKGINLGNFCGQNFTEDASKYTHNFWILDTDAGSIEAYENPYSLNFYRFDLQNQSEEILRSVKNNAVLSVICSSTQENIVESILKEIQDKVITKRVTYSRVRENNGDEAVKIEALTNTDYLQQLHDKAIEKIGNSPILVEELMHVIEGV